MREPFQLSTTSQIFRQPVTNYSLLQPLSPTSSILRNPYIWSCRFAFTVLHRMNEMMMCYYCTAGTNRKYIASAHVIGSSSYGRHNNPSSLQILKFQMVHILFIVVVWPPKLLIFLSKTTTEWCDFRDHRLLLYSINQQY